MNNFENEIKQVLIMFGPSLVRTIQQKLDLRNLIKSMNEIDLTCESMVERNLIKIADGFNDKAYKI